MTKTKIGQSLFVAFDTKILSLKLIVNTQFHIHIPVNVYEHVPYKQHIRIEESLTM